MNMQASVWHAVPVDLLSHSSVMFSHNSKEEETNCFWGTAFDWQLPGWNTVFKILHMNMTNFIS